ncbi:MAG: SDR family oxidoreductase [Pseudomonadota bacterium]
MEQILVTGAGGYIGSTLVPVLLKGGYRVRAIDRFFFGEHLLEDHSALELVREDARLITPDHLQDVDYVIDLAAVSNDPSGELFEQATWEINHLARARVARLAKSAGVRRYILPSSCSIYGFQPEEVICTESDPVNPLTTYARANLAAERDVLPLADEHFCVVVLRQATVYGYSPRMRFDLAVNGMTWGAWSTGRLPLMRDGTQWRPMVHVRDAAAAQLFMLTAPADQVSGRIFNVGSAENNYQLGKLGELVQSVMPQAPTIEWYGDPDHRSYRVSCEQIEALGWRARYTAADGAREIVEHLEAGTLTRTPETITLDWYRELVSWHERIRELQRNDGILDIAGTGHLLEERSA